MSSNRCFPKKTTFSRLDIDIRCMAYSQGAGAFLEGISLDDCPYPKNVKSLDRLNWCAGWLAEQEWRKYGDFSQFYPEKFAGDR